MEMHIVCAGSKGETAVIGVFIKEGAENNALKEMFSKLPAKVTKKNVKLSGKINLNDFVGGAKAFYRYDGSLTTPPCAEGVKWSVADTPIEASAVQIAAFRKVFDGNYRPVQPLNGRKIYAAE
jgi:carbonic anhydrase